MARAFVLTRSPYGPPVLNHVSAFVPASSSTSLIGSQHAD